MNSKSNDEKCFKWAVIATLHQALTLSFKLRELACSNIMKCYWKGLQFPLAIQKIGRFEGNNPGIAVNVLFNKKESIYIARRSELNGECSKQVNLLMAVDGES